MEKLITLLALRLIFKNEKTVVELYKGIYPDKKTKQIKKVSTQPKNNMGTFVKPKDNKQTQKVLSSSREHNSPCVGRKAVWLGTCGWPVVS